MLLILLRQLSTLLHDATLARRLEHQAYHPRTLADDPQLIGMPARPRATGVRVVADDFDVEYASWAGR